MCLDFVNITQDFINFSVNDICIIKKSGIGISFCSTNNLVDTVADFVIKEPDFKLLAGAGHFVFMAPCNEEQIRAMPALCTDADGVDREDIHRNLISEAGRFFSHVLTHFICEVSLPCFIARG